MRLEYQSTTTLERIRAADPCKDGWTRLLAHLGKTKADDEPLDLMTVLNSNGLDDAIWVLSYAMPDNRLTRHFQAWCAEQVLHLYEEEYPDDPRVRDQINMLRNDDATDAARDAAWGAAQAAARAAARAEARAEARAAAWDVAQAAAWAAARAAAWDVARDAARDAAQAAAWGAAQAAAWGAVQAAAWDVARDAQETQLRKMMAQGKSI
jgi:hypothetical protein